MRIKNFETNWRRFSFNGLGSISQPFCLGLIAFLEAVITLVLFEIKSLMQFHLVILLLYFFKASYFGMRV
jgi:hypothetical protein